MCRRYPRLIKRLRCDVPRAEHHVDGAQERLMFEPRQAHVIVLPTRRPSLPATTQASAGARARAARTPRATTAVACRPTTPTRARPGAHSGVHGRVLTLSP
eukprot:scaffold13676_cov138-Isochrysis_galbana.AAC.5